MAGYVYLPSSGIRSGTAVSSGDDASFPAANVLTRYPYRPWKSSGNVASGTTYIGINLGSALTVAAITVDHINITSILPQAASNSGFSTSLINPGAVTISRNPVSRRYKLCYLTAGTAFASQARQYWRILANTSTLYDGSAGKLVVGSLVLWGTATTWASGTSSYEELPLEKTRPNDDFDGGGSEPVILGNPYAVITLGAAPASRAAMRSDLMTMLADEGIGRWFGFYKNAGDTSEFYRVRRAADVAVRQTKHSVIEFDRLVLEESV